MICRLYGAKSSSAPMIAGLLLIGIMGIKFSEVWIKKQHFLFKNMNSNCRLQNGGYFVSVALC